MQEEKKSPDEGCVLVVDDEEPIRESLSELLGKCGFTVLLAESYDSAVAVLEANREIETILADWKMPGKSGLDILRYVNEKAANVPLIFLTGFPSLNRCQEALREGAFDYILKPIDDKDRVILPLRHAVEKYRLKKENQRLMTEISELLDGHEALVEDLLKARDSKEEDMRERILAILDRYDRAK